MITMTYFMCFFFAACIFMVGFLLGSVHEINRSKK